MEVWGVPELLVTVHRSVVPGRAVTSMRSISLRSPLMRKSLSSKWRSWSGVPLGSDGGRPWELLWDGKSGFEHVRGADLEQSEGVVAASVALGPGVDAEFLG